MFIVSLKNKLTNDYDASQCHYCTVNGRACSYTNRALSPNSCHQCILAGIFCSNSSKSPNAGQLLRVDHAVLAENLRMIAREVESTTPFANLREYIVKILQTVWSLPLTYDD